MKLSLNKTSGQLITSCLQVVFIIVPLHAQSWEAAAVCMPLAAIISLIAWSLTIKRRNTLARIPVSRIVSAAQGHVHLAGRGRPIEGVPLLSPVSSAPCLWYKIRVLQKRSNPGLLDLIDYLFDGASRIQVNSEESDDPFIIDDGSGTATIMDPENAEIICSQKQKHSQDGDTIIEYRFNINCPLYVLGDFRTLDRNEVELDKHADTGELLVQWKTDQKTLRERFDLDKDQQINTLEWNLARQAARREVEKQHQEFRNRPNEHMIEKPASGKLYLISDIAPKKLAFRYLLWSFFHLAFFLISLRSIPLIWQHLS